MNKLHAGQHLIAMVEIEFSSSNNYPEETLRLALETLLRTLKADPMVAHPTYSIRNVR